MSLVHCPVCHYTLAGLPAPHRCPECSFGFDVRTRVWHVERFSSYGGLWVLVVCLLLLSSWISLGNLKLTFNPTTPYVVFLRQTLILMILALAALLAIRRIIAFQTGLFVATTPDGIVYRLNSCHICVIPWRALDPVRVVRCGRRRRVLVNSTGSRTVDLAPALRDPPEIGNFVSTIRTHLQEYAHENDERADSVEANP